MLRLPLRRALALAAVAATGLTAPLAAQPDPTPEQVRAAERLIVAMRAREGVEEMIEPMVQQMAPQLGNDPQMLAWFRDEMERMLAWEALHPEYRRAYVETYTVEEMDALSAFYETEMGQRLVRKVPELSLRLMEINQERVQAEMPAMMQRLMARLEADPDAKP